MAKALIVSAHPDDELLGCGATAEKLHENGWGVSTLVLWRGRGYEDDNAMDRYPLIDTVKRIETIIAEVDPVRIYTHSKADLNVDHGIAHRAVLTATRPFASFVEDIYCFETASSTECNFDECFRPNVFEKITKEQLEIKLMKLHTLYGDEMRMFPHPRSSEYLRATAVRWGAAAGTELAEAFELVRLIR